MTDKTIQELAEDLERCHKSYVTAAQNASVAQNHATDALNRLNSAQKAFEARMETLRKNAPHDSDWGRARLNRHALTHAQT